jgi:hypothetical protein
LQYIRIFPADYLTACEISAADDVQAIFGIVASPSATGSIAPSVGRIEFTTANGLRTNYVRSAATPPHSSPTPAR